MSKRGRVESLPVFPLTGTLLLPGTYLPLNIFEPRYLAMVRDALDGDRAIGMIQPEVPGLDNWGIVSTASGEPKLYPVGCKGRIVEDQLQADGRYHILLAGVCRFRVARELEPVRGYRRVEADLAEFADDRRPRASAVDTTALRTVFESWARRKCLEIDTDPAETLSGEGLVNLLSTALPFSPAEKQALLEARSPQDRARLLTILIDIEREATARTASPRTVH